MNKLYYFIKNVNFPKKKGNKTKKQLTFSFKGDILYINHLPAKGGNRKFRKKNIHGNFQF